MATLTTSTQSNQVGVYYDKLFLESAEDKLVLYELGKKKHQPGGTRTTTHVHRMGNIAASTTALTEGVANTESSLAVQRYTVPLYQYGQHVKMSDLLETTALDEVVMDVVKRLGYTAAKSVDQIIRDHLIATATTNIKYASSATTDNTITAGMILSISDLLKPLRVLKAGSAPTFSDDMYRAVIHPYQTIDIMSDTSAGGFLELSKYKNGVPEKGEIGKAWSCKILESANMTSAANAGSIDVYRALVLADEAFVTTTFDKDSTKLIIKPSDSGGAANPYNQLGSVGYKIQMGVYYVGGSFSNHNGASPDLCIQLRSAATS